MRAPPAAPPPPVAPVAPPRALDRWGIPKQICQAYHAAGVQQMYEWQAECLQQHRDATAGGQGAGGNLLYSAPTSGGKTLVAEVLLLQRLLSTKQKALFVLPYVALVQEKARRCDRPDGAAADRGRLRESAADTSICVHTYRRVPLSCGGDSLCGGHCCPVRGRERTACEDDPWEGPCSAVGRHARHPPPPCHAAPYYAYHATVQFGSIAQCCCRPVRWRCQAIDGASCIGHTYM